jgi:hypothetical protein
MLGSSGRYGPRALSWIGIVLDVLGMIRALWTGKYEEFHRPWIGAMLLVILKSTYSRILFLMNGT